MMLVQTLILYVVVAAACAWAATRLAHRHFPYEWSAYFIVGLVGGWVGGSLFGRFGWIIDGLSVAAVAAGAVALIEADYQIACRCMDPECTRVHYRRRRSEQQDSQKPPTKAA